MSQQVLYESVRIDDTEIKEISAPSGCGQFIFDVDEENFTGGLEKQIAGILVSLYTKNEDTDEYTSIQNRTVLWNVHRDISIPIIDIPKKCYVSMRVILTEDKAVKIINGTATHSEITREFPISITFDNSNVVAGGGGVDDDKIYTKNEIDLMLSGYGASLQYSNGILSLLSASGEVIGQNISIDTEHTVDVVQDAGSGIYYVKLSDGNGTEMSRAPLPQYVDTSTTVRLTNRMSSQNLNVDYQDGSIAYNLLTSFSSVWTSDNTQTGPGTMFYSVNGTLVHSEAVSQGDQSFNIKPFLTPSSTANVRVTVVDSNNVVRYLDYVLNVSAAAEYYVVTWVADGVTMQTQNILKGNRAEYSGPDIVKEGYYYEGWDTDTSNVTSDLTVNAILSQKVLPDAPRDVSQFDYLYSNDPNDTSAYNWGELEAICDTNNPYLYFSLNDMVKIVLKDIRDNSLRNDIYWRFRVADKKHYKVHGAETYAGVYFDIADATLSGYQWNSGATNVGGFATSKLYTRTIPLFKAAFPDFILNSMVTVEYKRLNGDSSAQTTTIVDKIVVPSGIDMGIQSNVIQDSTYPYTNEMDLGSENLTFPCYTSNASRIKKYYNGNGAAASVWTSTPVTPGSSNVVIVYTSGAYNGLYAANDSHSVGFGFNLGRPQAA